MKKFIFSCMSLPRLQNKRACYLIDSRLLHSGVADGARTHDLKDVENQGLAERRGKMCCDLRDTHS